MQFQYISIDLISAYNKNKQYKTLDFWFRDMVNFNFSKKSLGLVSPPHFVYGFSRKIFPKLYPINWPNVYVWLPLILQIMVIMCITIVFHSGCDAIKLEINLIFLIKPLTKKSKQKLKYLENEKTFWREYKAFFIIFKGLSAAKYCLRPESVPFREWIFRNHFIHFYSSSFHI